MEIGKFIAKPKSLFVMLAILGLIAGILLTGSPVQALCMQPEEDGRWKNYDPNTRSITKAHIRFVCQDQVLNGQLYPPGPAYYVHLWGACHPTDCDWGEVGAYRNASGWIRTTYHQGHATQHVWVKAYTGYTIDWLRVYIWTDFKDPNRKDYATNDWFNRE